MFLAGRRRLDETGLGFLEEDEKGELDLSCKGTEPRRIDEASIDGKIYFCEGERVAGKEGCK